MNLNKLLLVLAIGAGAYHYSQRHRYEDSPESMDISSNASSGFVSLPAVLEQSPSGVFVVAAQNCPRADAQRADRLAEELSRIGVTVVRTHSVDFDTTNAGQADLDKINRVMTGQLPVVFVGGRAKANPTLEEVVAELKGPVP